MKRFKVVDQISREERDMLTKDKTFIIPNINEEARMFEWAGIGFGEEETFKLSKAIKVIQNIYCVEVSSIEWC